ncbi:MAG: excinuclease ABC subunit UvrC [Deltaproteobacteria bacterium]|nr:excinuclease ABC subunit UvrC [Deltaproteobacteria bacterium]
MADDAAHAVVEKVSLLPVNPGVYLMKDRQGSVIYVGKAKSLRSRVRSYFQRQRDAAIKTRLMVSKIADIETIVTKTEKAALILENSLIKKYRPRYNVDLRDDKEYPYLRLATKEPFPNLTIVRRLKKDGNVYFGPFTSSQAVRETVKLIHKSFPLRKCTGKRLRKERPCMYHQLGQCYGPCCMSVDAAVYQETVKAVQLFLQGRGSDIIAGLKQQMERESAALNFEAAAVLRDRIGALEKTLEKQSVVSLDFVDRDVFAFYREAATMGITALFVRSGRLIGSRNFLLKRLHLKDGEVLSSFLSQYYQRGAFVPQEIIIQLSLADREVIGECLREKKGAAVQLIVPRRGHKKELLEMAAQNAEIMFARAREAGSAAETVLKQLQQKLHLQNYPYRVACFDISNIMGTSAVGSMVIFEDGEPVKSAYRRFRIKTVDQPDDYAMMLEVLRRHVARLRAGDPRPDLIVVDGGKGQLGVLLTVLQEMELLSIDAVALAKDRAAARRGSQPLEKVFLPYRKNPVPFKRGAPPLLMLQHIRDEAHRFAVSYHSLVKNRKDFTSVLETIPGIGKQTVKDLLKHFGSLDGVRQAMSDEILAVPGMTKKRAAALGAFFQEPEED